VYGIEPEVAKVIAEKIEQHAARTLYEDRPPPLPAAFINYLSGLMA
jgi:hypothetical protein